MANKLYEVLESRILLLDGGFGTMVQQYGFTEEDYRGERFRDWNVLLKGCRKYPKQCTCCRAEHWSAY